MLYFYATVFNNSSIIEKSLESIDKINTDHKFLIVDNYSNDGTYEILNKLKDTHNIVLERAQCTRGKGRQIAMELAKEESKEDDLFMYFDMDTIYYDNYIIAIEKNIKTLKRNCIFLNSLCYKDANFKVPWRDLNAGEDSERWAHFISLGYDLVVDNPEIIMWENQDIKGARERRYAIGLSYMKREIKHKTDLLIGFNVNSFKNLKLFFHRTKVRKRFYVFYSIIFLYIKLFKKTYNYSGLLNTVYVEKYSRVIKYDDI